MTVRCWIISIALAVTGWAAVPDSEIEAARENAETLAQKEEWVAAIEAGVRLRTLQQKKLGPDAPAIATTELFMGRARLRLRAPALAESHFRRALALQEKAQPPDDKGLATTCTLLAAALKELSQTKEAATLLQRALELQIKASGPEHEDTATAARNVGWFFRLLDRSSEAQPYFEQVRAIRLKSLGATDPAAIASAAELLQIQELNGDLSGAEKTGAEWVAGAEAHFGTESPELLAALVAWGSIADRAGRFVEAEPRYRRALVLQEKLQPPDEAALALRLTDLGWCLKNLARYDDAEPLLRRALELRQRVSGPGHEDTAWSLRNLGWVLRLKSDFPAAVPLFEEALKIRERTLGLDAPLTLESLVELGDLHWLRGAYDAAETVFATRQERALKRFGPQSAEVAAAWHSLAVVRESARQWPAAKDAAEKMLAAQEKRLGPNDPGTASALGVLARIVAGSGDFEAAQKHYAKLARWLETQPTADPQWRGETLRQFAITTLRSGQADAAGPLFQESLRWHEATFGPRDSATLRALGDLWSYYGETKRPAEALPHALELARRSTEALGADAPATLTVCERLGQLCLTLNQRTEAAKWFEQAQQGWRQRFGPESNQVLEALNRQAAAFELAGIDAMALPLRREQLQASERKFGVPSVQSAEAAGALAALSFKMGDLPTARELWTRQESVYSKNFGPTAEQTLLAARHLADVLSATRDWAAAIELRERVLAGSPPSGPERAAALFAVGEARLAIGHLAAAEQALTEAYRLALTPQAPLPSIAASSAILLSSCSLRQYGPSSAERWLEQFIANAVPARVEDAAYLSQLSEALAAAGALPAAERAQRAALVQYGGRFGDQDERTISALLRLAILHLRQGLTDAIPYTERALTASEALNGANSVATGEILGWHTLAQLEAGQSVAAQQSASRLLEICRNSLGENDPHTTLAHLLHGIAVWRAGGNPADEIHRAAEILIATWPKPHPFSRCFALWW